MATNATRPIPPEVAKRNIVDAHLKAIELYAIVKRVLTTEEWPRGRSGDLKTAHDEVKAAVEAFEPLAPLFRNSAKA